MVGAVVRRRQNWKMRARGDGFFVGSETTARVAAGEVVGQLTKDSCVAAACRMLLRDEGLDAPEAYLRLALKTTPRGADVSRAPEVLRQFGARRPYAFRSDLSWAELLRAVERGAAAAVVTAPGSPDEAHLVLVDGVEEDGVLVRNSLPEGCGSVYRVAAEVFLQA